MKLREWLTISDKKQAQEPVEVGGLELDGDGEVLESGHTLQQLEEDIGSREDAIDDLQRDIHKHQRKKKQAVEKARDAGSEADKKQYMFEAKEHKEAKEKKEKILQHLQKEQLTLKKLKLQHLQNNIGDGVNSDLDISVSNLDESSIKSAIEDGSDDIWEASQNMQEIDEAISFADQELAEVDINDIRTEVEEDSSSDFDLSDRSLDDEEDIDQAIDDTLERMDDNL
jgi:tetratricopeptide (TPR) repeat protein